MKKALLTAAVICLVSLFGLSSCADAMVNDGNNIRKYVGSDGGANGGAVPFSMYNDKMDFQVWTDYNGGCTTQKQDGALVIVQTGNWYGVAICSAANANDSSASGAIYDMSKIAKITFEAKAETEGTKLNFSACTENAVSYPLSTEYQSFEYDMSKASHAKSGNHYCMVSLVQNETTTGVIHYVKNIAFWDASGTEIIPTLVQ